MYRIAVTLWLALALAACVHTPQRTQTHEEAVAADAPLPGWLQDPREAGGFASAQCALRSGNDAIDRALAVAAARQQLSATLQERAATMDSTLQTHGGGKPFAAVSPPLIREAVAAVRPQRSGAFLREGEAVMCALLALPAAGSRLLFDNLIDAATAQVPADTRHQLYRQFLGDSYAPGARAQTAGTLLP